MNLKKTLAVFAVALAVLIAGCATEESATVSVEPFIGGTEGITVSFENGRPPAETFDRGTTPFDISVKLENKGEYSVPKEKVKVSITGVLASEFGVSENDLVKNPSENLLSREKRDSTILESPEVFAEFNDINYKKEIIGSALPFTLRADVCYNYATTARSKLCIRRNLQNPSEGICEVSQNKQIFNSGSPIQIQNLREDARGQDKIGFNFEISHKGNGNFYRLDTECDDIDRKNIERVELTVDTGLEGLSCSGLTDIRKSPSGTAITGTAQVIDGFKSILCTQEVLSPGDYEVPLTITAEYDYENSVSTQVVVKRSE